MQLIVINWFSFCCLIGAHRLVCGWMINGWMQTCLEVLKSGREVEIQGIITNI